MIEELLKSKVEDIIEKHDELGMRASGDFARSLEYNVNKTTNNVNINIKSNSYVEQMVQGRKPSDSLPPVSRIEKWIADKGIQPINENTTAKGLAFAIAKKIAREGTRAYRQGGTDLLEDTITDNWQNEVIKEVAKEEKVIATKNILKQFQKINKQ